MARLTKLPEKSIIDGLKGTLDFYIIHLNPTIEEGIPVCRTWPRYNPENRTQASKDASAIFGYVSKAVILLPLDLQESLRIQVSGTRLTWKDLSIRAYLNGDLIYPQSTTLDGPRAEDE
ncbi:hypothetical protein ES703_61568 [subsurface metagenome]